MRSITTGKSLPLDEVATAAMYQEKLQIQATATHTSPASPPPFVAQFAEIEVDTETGIVTVIRFVSVVDAGTIINLPLAEGQIEGAVAMGLGYALTKSFYWMNMDGC